MAKHKTGSKRKSSTLEEPSSTNMLPKTEQVDSKPLEASNTVEESALSKVNGISDRPRKRSRHTLDAVGEGGNKNEGDSTEAQDEPADTPKKSSSKKRNALAAEIEVDINAPEPPSKKALRQLKKGKPLPPSKSGAESTPEPEPAKKADAEKRSDHCVWIGNLAWTISKTDLRKYLVEYSDITDEMITRIHMPGPNDKKTTTADETPKVGKTIHNKGFAYVDFSTAEGAVMAIELSEQLLSGRRLLIKDHKSFEGRPEKTKEESRNDGKPPSKRIFLGNLAFDTTEEIIKEHFQKCGPVESVKVATFEDSGKCKGYAWAVFEEIEAAQAAVRGFVRIEEEASDASESESEGAEAKVKKVKTRKWWVNKMKGRPLKIEFAEDAQVRYKKRYGKDGTKRAATQAPGAEVKEAEMSRNLVPAKVDYRQPYAARLTGGIVESTGKKTTF
jgi:RNA recognition motif-containing protein